MEKKVRLTKNELQKQQMELKKYERFLPTLQLKKQQLQVEVRKAAEEVRLNQLDYMQKLSEIEEWAGLFMQYDLSFWKNLVRIRRVNTTLINIAGVKAREYKSVDFRPSKYSLVSTDPWIDSGIEAIKELLRFRSQGKLLRDKLHALSQELRKTSQRVNLFEQIMIPKTKENIRRIKIYLGDQERNAVGRAKIAKRKLALRMM